MVKLFLFIYIFFKDCVELRSWSNELLVYFVVILSMRVYGALFEQILLLGGEVLAGCSGVAKDW